VREEGVSVESSPSGLLLRSKQEVKPRPRVRQEARRNIFVFIVV